jgi:hypothetical protein
VGALSLLHKPLHNKGDSAEIPATRISVENTKLPKFREKCVAVGRVAGRAGAIRAIASSMPPHACPRQDRRRPTPRLSAAGEVTGFVLVAVYGFNNNYFVPRAAGGLRRGLVPQAKAA